MWGQDYRQTANDNMMVVIMIETPLGVANAKEIAAVPGVDVIFAASTDLGNFSGTKQGDPRYEQMVATIHDTVLGRGLKLGGPLAWKNRAGFSFFQGPGEAVLIQTGAKTTLQPSSK
jgi:2-keto-3-deoxy-L-rhamnonate aldolase RhmA